MKTQSEDQIFKTNEVPAVDHDNLSSDFRLYLQTELIRRCRQNANYSQRAFAKFLGVENSWLSKVMRRQKNMSPRSINKIGERLGLSPYEINKFLKSISNARPSQSPPIKFAQLNQDTFEVISEWYHFAILELMKLKSFKMDTRWISSRLGITHAEAQAAIERLVRVGILREQENIWVDESKGFTTHNLGVNYSSSAHRKLQESILAKSAYALKNLPIERRDHSSMMMATNKSKLEEAKRRIDEFRYSLCEFLEDCSERDAVFQLSVSLFPLAENITENENKES